MSKNDIACTLAAGDTLSVTLLTDPDRGEARSVLMHAGAGGYKQLNCGLL